MDMYFDETSWKLIKDVQAEMIESGKIKKSKRRSNTTTADAVRFLVKEGLKNYLFEESR